MNTSKQTARIAGFWYLLMALFYSFSMIYVDNALYVKGDTQLTISNLTSSEPVFYIGFLSCLIGHITFLMLANTLYKLFEPIQKDLARLMVIFIAVGVSIAFLNRLNQFTAIQLLSNKDMLTTFGIDQINTLVMMFMNIHKNGEFLATIFWGLWLLPLGLLIIKSDLIPKIIGILSIAACISYLIDFILFFFFPSLVISMDLVLSLVEICAEVTILLWLLIKGVK